MFALLTPIWLFLCLGGNLAVASKCKGRIVGGNSAKYGDIPYIVSVYNRTQKETICGGSLIAENWVLTAAHCFDDMKNGEIQNFHVVAGDLKLDAKDYRKQILELQSVIMHPSYRGDTMENDICLLKLKKSAKLNKFVDTINLPSRQKEYSVGTRCTVAGWGLTENNVYSDDLLKVEVPVVKCQSCYPKNYTVNSMMCAGEERRDSCQGDSGGPLVCSGELSGIVSFGPEQCGKKDLPGVYTKTSHYIDWISRHVPTLRKRRRNSSSCPTASGIMTVIVLLIACVVQ